MQAKDRIILALDVDSAEEALRLAELLKDDLGAFKIGMQLFNAVGPDILRQFTQLGAGVFVDLKFHDIPNTVAAAARVMTRLGAFMFNLHAAGGREMMRSARAAADSEAEKLGCPPPLLVAVTVLTSVNQQQLETDMGITGKKVEDVVTDWAQMAQECGMDGVVCSPWEITAVRRACGADFLLVTPGIRPDWSAAGDQKRVTTPRQALLLGCDYMVIGRPVTGAKDPSAAAAAIIRELEASTC
jgi:orotidine-5'-phosphate decarboxylase